MIRVRQRGVPGVRLPAVLLLAAYLLRVWRLGAQNVWWDEGLAVWAVRKGLVETTLWTAGDVHPPLFFWTLWPWIRLVGQSEYASRYLTVVWGVLAAAVAWALGRRLGGRSAGLLSLGLVAASPFAVWWSMELRMYMLAGLAILLAVYALVRWWDGEGQLAGSLSGQGAGARAVDDRPVPGSPRGLLRRSVGSRYDWLKERADRRSLWLAVHQLAALSALYTVYLAAVAVVAFNLAVAGRVLRGQLKRRQLRSWLIAQLIAGTLYLPWLALAMPRMQSWSSIRTPVSPGFVIQLWATLLATGVSTYLSMVKWPTLAFWLVALVGLSVLLGGRLAPAREPEASCRQNGVSAAGAEVGAGARAGVRELAAALLTLFVLLPPVAVWAATQPRSFFYSPQVEARYLLPFAAPVYVLLAWLVAEVRRRRQWLGTVLAAGLMVPLVAYLPRYYSGRHLTSQLYTMVLAIWSQAEPGDVVLLVSGNRYPLFHYYYDRPWVQPAGRPVYEYPADRPPRWSNRPPVIDFPDRGSRPVEAHPWQARLEEVVARYRRVWLVEYGRNLQDPRDRVEAWLNRRLKRVLSEGYGADALHLYTRDGRPPQLRALSSRFPGTIAVTRGGRPVEELGAGLLPVVGLPARLARPGDTLNVTLYVAPPGVRGPPRGPVPAPAALSLWPQSGEVPLWTAGVQTERPSGPRRVRLVAPISQRTPAGNHRLVWDAGQRLGLATVRVTGTAPLVGEPGPTEIDFGGEYRLVAAGLRRNLQPGQTLVVDLYWQRGDGKWERGNGRAAVRGQGAGPVIFVHLIGPPRPSGEVVWAGHDGLPSSGPWSEHSYDTVFDRHVLVLPPDTPPGAYELEVGLYDPQTGDRWPVSGPRADPEARRAVLGQVEVRQRPVGLRRWW